MAMGVRSKRKVREGKGASWVCCERWRWALKLILQAPGVEIRDGGLGVAELERLCSRYDLVCCAIEERKDGRYTSGAKGKGVSRGGVKRSREGEGRDDFGYY